MNIVKRIFSLKKICTLMISFFMVFTLVASNITFASTEDRILPMGILYLDYFIDTGECRWFNGAKPLDVEIVELQAFEKAALRRSSGKNKLCRISSISSHDLIRFFRIGDMITDEIELREEVCHTQSLIVWLNSVLKNKVEDYRQFGQEYNEEYTIRIFATLKNCDGVEFKDEFACITCYSKSPDAESSRSDEDIVSLESDAHYNSEDSDTDSWIFERQRVRKKVTRELDKSIDREQRDLDEVKDEFKRLRANHYK